MDFKEEIIKILSPVLKIQKEMIDIPPDSKMGHFAVPMFKYAKEFRKSPVKIAEELVEKLEPSETITSIKNIGPYINFFVNQTVLIEYYLSQISQLQEKYGNSDKGKSKCIAIDLSSPNIAKPFGIAHIRSTVIGNSIHKIYETLGYKAWRINHLGDWGTQFGKLMVAFTQWGNEEEFQKGGIEYLVKIYVEFGQKAKEDSSLLDQARKWFKDLEDGKEQATKLWKHFRELSLKEFKKYYDRLGVEFDHFHGESFYNEQLDDTVDYVKSKISTEISDGALIVDLKSKKIKTPLLLRKTDGATTYHTRDIAAALYRLRTFDPEALVYVVGTPQAFHFKQLFTTLGMMGEDQTKFHHVNFGNMTYEGVMMSTRHGNFIPLSEVLDKATSLALETIEKKNPDLKNKKKVAEQIGIGAIIFGDLSNDRIRDVDFQWDKALSFEGDTAPYLQYTHARICSIKRKIGKTVKRNVTFTVLAEPIEFELTKTLGNFPTIIQQAAKAYKPSLIATYLLDLAQIFNKFYAKCHISGVEEELQVARLLLADCTRIVLQKGLSLLGIQAPEEM